MISWLEKHNKVSWAITALIAIGIFYISSRTAESLPYESNLISILYHLSAFFLLALFLSVSLIKGKRKSFFLISITAAILYALSDELHQFFVPGRSLSIKDTFTDVVGISFASLIYLITLVYRQNKIKRSQEF